MELLGSKSYLRRLMKQLFNRKSSLCRLDGTSTVSPDEVGRKGRNINWLIRQSCRVPSTYYVGTQVHDHYLEDPEAALLQISRAIRNSLYSSKKYVVRSSATSEDRAGASYAGQFISNINVTGLGNLVSAVRAVFDSAAAANVKTYQEQLGDQIERHRMAVVIQEMIEPIASGVSVSRNPLTGLNEIVIEAVPGSGVVLVQDGVTPDHWVYKWGRFVHEPGDPILPRERVEQIANETKRLGDAYGTPVDLEWVFDGNDVYWVQIRPLTGLDTINIYSNTISREMLPGLIKPLIWSVNVPLVNTAWIKLFEELIGPTDLEPQRLAKSFYYHAYFNMGIVGQIFELLGFPRDSLELLMGFENAEGMPTYRPSLKTFRFLPRIARFLFRLSSYIKRLHRDLDSVEKAYRDFEALDLAGMSEAEVLETYDRLYDVNLILAYHNILVPLSMGVYNGLLSNLLRRYEVDPLNFDVEHDMEELKSLDPKIALAGLKQRYDRLSAKSKEKISQVGVENVEPSKDLELFLSEFEKFLDEFGHFSESGNDFSSVPWREDPQHVIEMINRHRVQSGGDQLRLQDLEVNPISRWMVRFWANHTRKYLLERERVSSTYTFGYGLFRRVFTSLGEKLVERGTLDQRDDIFFLSLEEISELVNAQVGKNRYLDSIARRKAEMEVARGIILPDIFYDEEVPPIGSFSGDLSTLHGMPTSRGYYEGKVAVIETLAEASKFERGDVLVVPYSDVAWTPLFGLAGAVIAQSGGVLSHSSIVAREMGIPCVVSVPNACQLRDGTIVVVDGHRGEIRIKEQTT